MKKIILILLFSIIFSNATYAEEYDQLDDINYNGGWEQYKSNEKLPLDTEIKSLNGLFFNKEIWEEKRLIVYGDYTQVANNDFKIVVNGYYSKNGNRGEYRYHGKTVFNSNVANNDFPPDAISSTKLENKRWVFQAWNPESFGYRLYKITNSFEKISEWNDFAINGNSPESKVMAQQINSSLTWPIKKTTYTGLDSISDTEPINYLTVQSPPTTRGSGLGIMYHRTNDGDDWYQTFPITRLTEKVMLNTPVTAKIENISVESMDVDGNITLSVDVSGILEDNEYFLAADSDLLIQTHYTRNDIIEFQPWKMTLTNKVNNKPVESYGQTTSYNTGIANFKVQLSHDEYLSVLRDDGTFDIEFEGSAEVTFTTGATSIGYTNGMTSATGTTLEEEESTLINHMEFKVTAPKEILDVWKFPVSINEINVDELKEKYITLNGRQLSTSEAQQFLNGQYKFPEIKEDRIYDYKIVYVSNDDIEYHYKSYVLVYDSLPRAQVRVLQDSGKINRKISVTSDKDITPAFLRANSTVQISHFNVTSEEGHSIYYGNNTSSLKEFLLKQTGTVHVNVTVSNEFGSRAYQQQIYVGKDYQPDIVAVVWNNNLARQDKLDIFCEPASLDGDTVTAVHYDIYYDENKDNIAEKLVYSDAWNGSTDYTPDKLGMYEIHFTTTESFGEETIASYITNADYKSVKVKREFFVSNLVPMTKLYTDIEYNFPKVESAFILDTEYPQAEVSYIKSNAVDTKNKFRINNMLADIDVWDTKTYVFTQTGYKRVHSGSSYPSSTTNYSQDGYNGTLTRDDVDNYRYEKDHGQFVTKTDSKTATASRSTSGVGLSDSHPPSSVSYNSGGYSGTLSEDSYQYHSEPYDSTGDGVDDTFSWSRTKTYSGTVTKSVQVWESDWRWHDDYYGDYSGTVYKYVKQSYSPNYKIDTNKYYVYFAKDGVRSMADFNYLQNITKDAFVILIGQVGLKGMLNEDVFITYNSDTSALIDEVIKVIKAKNPFVNHRLVLTNESFSLNFSDVDPEKDPWVDRDKMQYVHDAQYFDNSMGQEVNTYTTFVEDQYTNQIINQFSKVGKYTIYRQVEDQPLEDPSQGLESGVAALEVVVHRKPIADYTLDWTYLDTEGKYQTIFHDFSHDLDHELSDANKGITETKAMYKEKSSTRWHYGIPDKLSPGVYEFMYIVKDIEGVWSSPKVEEHDLKPIPPPQIFEGKLKSQDDKFSLNSIPASESLTFFDIHTRYPYAYGLEYSIYNSDGVEVVSANAKSDGVQNFNSLLDLKQQQDIYWSPHNYEIPSTLSDGTYTTRFTTVPTILKNNTAYKSFNIVVETPINPKCNFSDMVGSEENIIEVTTSKYVNKVSIELFSKTAHSVTLNMNEVSNDGATKTWQVTYLAPGPHVPAGPYQGLVNAQIPSGKVEDLEIDFQLEHLKISYVNIYGDWNHWRGQEDKITGKKLEVNPHRFLSHENIHIESEVIGNPDRVEITMSNELMQMTYKTKSGITYRHDEFGFPIVTYPLAMNTTDNLNFAQEIILPLAGWTMSYDDVRQRQTPYEITVTAYKGSIVKSMTISDIELTGNIHDLIYFQPEE